jgi:hypothetical protein
MKLGLDIHGVIDTYPFLKVLSELLVQNGHEVHLITGAPYGAINNGEFCHAGVDSYILNLGYIKGVHYTHFYSILDHHIANGSEVLCDQNGCWLAPKIWDTAKALYCESVGIDFHIDDSASYATYFNTPIAVITKKPS